MVLALAPIMRTMPSTITRTTANITAYSATSCPSAFSSKWRMIFLWTILSGTELRDALSRTIMARNIDEPEWLVCGGHVSTLPSVGHMTEALAVSRTGVLGGHAAWSRIALQERAVKRRRRSNIPLFGLCLGPRVLVETPPAVSDLILNCIQIGCGADPSHPPLGCAANCITLVRQRDDVRGYDQADGSPKNFPELVRRHSNRRGGGMIHDR